VSLFETRSKQVSVVLVLLYAVLIAWFSLTPGTAHEPYFPHDDKVMHFCAYLVFSVLCLPFINQRYSLLFCAAGIFCYGVLIELVQAYVPLRDTSFLDVLANTSGVFSGMFLVLKAKKHPSIQKLL